MLISREKDQLIITAEDDLDLDLLYDDLENEVMIDVDGDNLEFFCPGWKTYIDQDYPYDSLRVEDVAQIKSIHILLADEMANFEDKGYLNVLGGSFELAKDAIEDDGYDPNYEEFLNRVGQIYFKVTIDYLSKNSGNNQGNDHEYVDLGLPSGTLWATCNVGANAPEDYGDYFAWGETDSKDNYNWKTYMWCNGSERILTKYSKDCLYYDDGFVWCKMELDPMDDAAYVKWGELWRMPSQEQIHELCNFCTWQWTQLNGINGQMVTGPNGNSMFTPAAGQRSGDSLHHAGPIFVGYYWSRGLNSDPDNPDDACCNLRFSFKYACPFIDNRYTGCSVRAVRIS